MIITIDGPAGSGKSSLAKNLAKELGFIHLNTGLLYRASAKIFLDKGLISDSNLTLPVLTQTDVGHLEKIHLEPQQGQFKIFVSGEDLTEMLNCVPFDSLSAVVAANCMVRQKVVLQQHAAAQKANLVIDGRDCGTVVFPDATLKFFLTASAQMRVLRVAKRNFANPTAEQIAVVAEQIALRDERDATRVLSPLVPAKDAIILDNSNLNAAETLAKAKQITLEHKLI